MKYFFSCLLCFFCVSLFAQTPEWLDLTSSNYPKSQYETAIGEGSTLAQAEENAIANLSRIFGLTVDTDSISQTQYENDTLKKSATQSTSINSSHNLINATIAQSAHDDNKSMYYALAIMPRQETLEILYKSIIDNENVISDYLESNEYETDSLYKFSFVDSAVELAKENEILFTQYTILGQNSVSTNQLELQYSPNRLESMLRSIVRSFGFSIEAEESEVVQSALESAITDMGMLLNRTNPAYILSVNTTYTGATSSFNVYLLKYASNIELLTADGSVITTFLYTGKEGGKTQEVAESVMYNRLAKIITEGDLGNNKASFSSQFSQYLQDLVK